MKEAFRVLGTLAAAAILSTSALAASPDRTVVGASNAPVTRLVQAPMGGKVIVSTFNSDAENAYDCCSGWTISSEDSVTGFRQDVAMPFTPNKNYAVKTITAAVGYVTGTNGVRISLNADAGGLPGAELRKADVTGLPTFGSCCVTASIGGKGTPVTAGTQYWVVVRTDKKSFDTWDAWNNNNIGATGPFAFNTGTGWQLTSGSLSAFSVTGKAAP